MQKLRQDIRKFEADEITAKLTEMGLPAFRSRQILEWLWKKNVASFSEMTNLPLSMREMLADSFVINHITLTKSQTSADRTIKNAFTLHSGQLVEGVLIPTTSRMTACISSQAGCSLTCKFCATGQLKLTRNLEAAEIFDQVAMMAAQSLEKYQIPLSNIVYMGMGEPLLNYREVMRSIDFISSPAGLGMSPQRITVSTAGIAKMIKKLGDDGARFNLALSLHAANENKRNQIMPINEHNNLESLADALNYFYLKTGTRVTLEYIAFRDFNDGPEDAAELLKFARKVKSKINIIEYNTVEGTGFKKSEPEKLEKFCAYLTKNGLIVNVRRSRGKDIDAACGQLANKSIKSTV